MFELAHQFSECTAHSGRSIRCVEREEMPRRSERFRLTDRRDQMPAHAMKRGKAVGQGDTAGSESRLPREQVFIQKNTPLQALPRYPTLRERVLNLPLGAYEEFTCLAIPDCVNVRAISG